VERALGLMCGSGALPAHVAAEARRQGWRVVAFAFGRAEGLEAAADRAIPSRLTALDAVLEALGRERVGAVVFAGKLDKQEMLALAPAADAAGRRIVAAAGGLGDGGLAQAVSGTLGALGIEVLDPRAFLGALLAPPGPLTPRAPSPAEWQDVRLGLELARRLAGLGAGQTVVVRQGAVAAVEGLEGTTEAIRRGCALAGAGAVVVKAVGPGHDYRFDVPAVGPETVAALAAGGAAVLALEAGRVLVLERAAVAEVAARTGLAVVGVEEGAP
jgi:DUF1009 family protein